MGHAADAHVPTDDWHALPWRPWAQRSPAVQAAAPPLQFLCGLALQSRDIHHTASWRCLPCILDYVSTGQLSCRQNYNSSGSCCGSWVFLNIVLAVAVVLLFLLLLLLLLIFNVN